MVSARKANMSVNSVANISISRSIYVLLAVRSSMIKSNITWKWNQIAIIEGDRGLPLPLRSNKPLKLS